MSTAARARAVVLRHALDAVDAAELLDMLGLGEDQPDPAPRVCDVRPARWSGTVLAVSAATEERLAQPPAPEPSPVPRPPAPAPVGALAFAPKPKLKPQAAPAPVERPCERCGTLAVPQTRYRLDPDGYRARGVRLRAAKGLCWQCYRPPKGPKPKAKPRRPAKRAVRAAGENLSCKDCGRELLSQKVWHARPDLREGRARAGGYGMCNGCYSVARNAGTLPEPATRKRVRAHPQVTIAPSYPVTCAECGPLGAPRDRREAVRLRDGHVNEHRRARGGRIVELVQQLAAAVDGDQHRHAWEWQPDLAALQLPCSCGEPSPATRSARR